MKTKIKNPRIRYHVSEEVAGELALTRRQTGFKSWDEFYRALLQKWNERSDFELRSEFFTHLESIDQKLEQPSPPIIKIMSLLEKQELVLQSILDGQVFISELIQRFNSFLSVAAGINPDSLQDQNKNVQPATPLTQREKILRKIGRM